MLENVDDLQIGKAGEHLVCADLILKGYTAFLAEQGLHYDVIVDNGECLIKIQVKTTRKPQKPPGRKQRIPNYLFHIRRCGKGGRLSYKNDDVDIFALVALDTRTIGYFESSKVKQTMFFRSREFEGKHYNEINAKKYAKVLELRKEGLTYSQISNELNIDNTSIGRIISEKTKPVKQGYYLDEFLFEKAILQTQ